MEEEKQLIEAYGFNEIDTSNNPVMRSWKLEDKRINWYFTTGTIMYQDNIGENIVIRNATLDSIEDLLIKVTK